MRVLAIDGGGVRGLYTATLLQLLRERELIRTDDAGKLFDLVTGTSTGGILAIGLAHGIPLDELVSIYVENAARIFPAPRPNGAFAALWWNLKHLFKPAGNAEVLRETLQKHFGDVTLQELWDTRKVRLCIPTLDLTTARPWVFKTPHLSNLKRDGAYSLVDVCVATGAAPIFLPIADIGAKNSAAQNRYFVDGGLWANNPTLVGLLEAMEVCAAEGNHDSRISVISLGTASPPPDQLVDPRNLDRGLWAWKDAALLSIECQGTAHLFMSKILARSLEREVEILRFPSSPVGSQRSAVLGLDQSKAVSLSALKHIAEEDVNHFSSLLANGDLNAKRIAEILSSSSPNSRA